MYICVGVLLSVCGCVCVVCVWDRGRVCVRVNGCVGQGANRDGDGGDKGKTGQMRGK